MWSTRNYLTIQTSIKSTQKWLELELWSEIGKQYPGDTRPFERLVNAQGNSGQLSGSGRAHCGLQFVQDSESLPSLQKVRKHWGVLRA